MIKIFNKICLYIKNLILPINLFATIFIVFNMFQRLEKNVMGESLIEFITVIIPFVLLIIIWLVNLISKNKEPKENLFYNVTSLLVVSVIFIFCYRALMDENMVFWHKYGYKINFNYFSDQMPAIRIMLYGLFVADILLIIIGLIKNDNSIDNNKDYQLNKQEMNKKIEKKS